MTGGKNHQSKKLLLYGCALRRYIILCVGCQIEQIRENQNEKYLFYPVVLWPELDDVWEDMNPKMVRQSAAKLIDPNMNCSISQVMM